MTQTWLDRYIRISRIVRWAVVLTAGAVFAVLLGAERRTDGLLQEGMTDLLMIGLVLAFPVVVVAFVIDVLCYFWAAWSTFKSTTVGAMRSKLFWAFAEIFVTPIGMYLIVRLCLALELR